MIAGPAIVTEMDTDHTDPPDHVGEVDASGNILIRPPQSNFPTRASVTLMAFGLKRKLENPLIAKATQQKPKSSRPITRPFRPLEVDPVTLDIIESALRNARYEMDAVLFRTAMSPGIREQHDEFPLIADRKGRMVVGQFGSFIGGFLARL